MPIDSMKRTILLDCFCLLCSSSCPLVALRQTHRLLLCLARKYWHNFNYFKTVYNVFPNCSFLLAGRLLFHKHWKRGRREVKIFLLCGTKQEQLQVSTAWQAYSLQKTHPLGPAGMPLRAADTTLPQSGSPTAANGRYHTDGSLKTHCQEINNPLE